MAITFNCPHCKRPHRIDDQYSGRLIRCKKCARVIRAPGKPPPLRKKSKSTKPVRPAAVPPASVSAQAETLEEAPHVPLVAPIEGPTTVTEQAPPPEIESTPSLP